MRVFPEAEGGVADPADCAHPTPDDGVIRADLAVAHPRLVLGGTFRRLPAAAVSAQGGFDDRPAEITFFQIDGVDSARVDRALATDETVSDCRLVATGGPLTYRVRVTGATVSLGAPAAERGVQVQAATRDGDGWRLELSAPDRDALRYFRDYCLGADVEVSIERLRTVDRWSRGPVALSARDRQTLAAALAAGYFDIPRNATQDDLADHLDVSGSAVSQRLRRATRALVAETVRPPGEAHDDQSDRAD